MKKDDKEDVGSNMLGYIVAFTILVSIGYYLSVCFF